ncbi:PREDICTED: uncharacterized protein LOC107071373 isoform X2 [Polistes dominula]|uniref:Uncharacterized protein LOC107071373 isoform X1 n=1 Tax=Polistes dominula TaxID=743375 RepID=A0ABM1J030_POLDO|nr:PREDICTED: uncharacterized protein LOC107071373 isoform X1 [Polistes dominula]XP_015185816.1 PREDICTED: uncharacterized protein LOC107071373 isoform X1 [Polistes dominula]XP_015185817.1 PREDICTED: uncharacterized protein LOC107071373 isoform X2 [Polistes dominula]
MVKKCAIKNCFSGSSVERKLKSKLNLRQTALFKVPKDPEMLKLWSSAISQQLCHNHFICELHFNSDNILKNYEKIKLQNGEVFELSRSRFALKKDAIPILSDVVTNGDTTSSNHFDTNNHCTDEEYLHETRNGSDLSELDQKFASSALVDELSNDAHSTENLSEEFEEKISIENNFILPNHDNSAPFSLAGILQLLKDHGVPQNWCWPKQSESKPDVILYYVDDYLEKLKLSIKIDDDLSVQVTILATGVSINFNYSIISAASFWNMLREIEISQFCSGTGVDERCSTACEGILQSDQKYKRFRREIRCLACRTLRNRLLISSRKKKEDVNNRYITIKRKLHAKQKRLRRLYQKRQQLKEQVEELRNQCATKKDNIIEEEIVDLPEAQKQAFRACFQVAKLKNAKQRCYTIE